MEDILMTIATIMISFYFMPTFAGRELSEAVTVKQYELGVEACLEFRLEPGFMS